MLTKEILHELFVTGREIRAEGKDWQWLEPVQNEEELWILLQRLKANGQLNSMIELGTASGGGLRVWNEMMKPNDLIISVDWGGLDILWDWKASDRDIQLVTGNTHDDETREKVANILQDKQVDFLFIDAQHHSKDVEQDLIDYGGFVRDNGIIAFHDTRLCRSFWDDFTGGRIDATNIPEVNRQESDVFHKEEIKISFGCGWIWKHPKQTVVNFK